MGPIFRPHPPGEYPPLLLHRREHRSNSRKRGGYTWLYIEPLSAKSARGQKDSDTRDHREWVRGITTFPFLCTVWGLRQPAPKTMCAWGRSTGRRSPQNSDPYPNILHEKLNLPGILRSGLWGALYMALLNPPTSFGFERPQGSQWRCQRRQLISSCGLTFISNKGAALVQKLGSRPPITKVASKLAPFLLVGSKPHWDVVMDWLQAISHTDCTGPS